MSYPDGRMSRAMMAVYLAELGQANRAYDPAPRRDPIRAGRLSRGLAWLVGSLGHRLVVLGRRLEGRGLAQTTL